MSRTQGAVLSAGQVQLDSRKLICRQGDTQEPQVTLVREGNVVRQIKIQCGCGEQLFLDCSYKDDHSETTVEGANDD